MKTMTTNFKIGYKIIIKNDRANKHFRIMFKHF